MEFHALFIFDTYCHCFAILRNGNSVRKGCIGIIASVTELFCSTCNWFSLTADGQLRNCLFGNDSGDVRAIFRGGGNDASIAKLMIDEVAAKKRGHGTDDLSFGHTSRPRYSIGG